MDARMADKFQRCPTSFRIRMKYSYCTRRTGYQDMILDQFRLLIMNTLRFPWHHCLPNFFIWKDTPEGRMYVRVTMSKCHSKSPQHCSCWEMLASFARKPLDIWRWFFSSKSKFSHVLNNSL